MATPHFLSAEAGRLILVNGGNAVDAAVAMVATQGVVAPETSGIGGDLFALVHAPGWDRPRALNSSGRMGSNADPQVLRDLGHTVVPRDHPYTAPLPGCVDGLATLSAELGTLDLSAVLDPAITLASEGFPVSAEQSRAFSGLADMYRSNRAVADFYPGGNPVEIGATVHRPDLARTLQLIADGGRDAFFDGQPGADILDVLKSHVVPEDLSHSLAEWVDPLSIDINDDKAWTIPPNSAGYLGPATLAVFMMLDPPTDPHDPMWWHLMIEAHRSLAWERDDVVSDPEHLQMAPEDLVGRDRLGRAAQSISRESAGTWPTKPSRPTGTAYMCVTDASGLSVSVIQSNYRAPDLRSVLRTRVSSSMTGVLVSTLSRGHPNELGPGKRPAHTLSPTIWTRGGDTSWILGTRGGEIQPQLIAQLAARAIIAGQPLDEAQSGPRWSMTEYGPGTTSAISLEPETGVVAHLEKLGHHVIEMRTPQPGWGPMSIIDRREDDALAAADPRVDTAKAMVF